MGRFFLADDDENDCRDPSSDKRGSHVQGRKSRNWAFVADPGEEGAMVPFDSNEGSTCTEQPHHDGAFRTSYPPTVDRHMVENSRTDCPPNHWHWDPDNFGRMEGMSDNSYYYPSGMVAKPSSWVFSRSFWIPSLILVLVAWALQNSLPPAPPPSKLNEDQYWTWRDYILQHSIQLLQSFSALALDTPLHIGSWWWRGLATDLHVWYQDGVIGKNSRVPTSCSVVTKIDNFNSRLKEKLVGQDLAVQLVSDALEDWVRRRSLQVNDNKTSKRPLLLFFTGFTSVGKSTLARALLDVIFSPAGCSDGHVLELSGAAYPTDDSFTSTPRVQLMHSILRHTHQRPEGSIILLRNVDSMSTEVFKWLLQTLSSPSSGGPVTQTSLPRAHDFGDIPAQCANAVFVFTSSSLGQNAIARALRQTGGSALHEKIHTSSLLADLAYEMNHKYKLEDSRAMLNALVPFGPLTQDALGDILRIKAKELSDRFSSTEIQDVKTGDAEEEQGIRIASPLWSRFILTDRAISFLISDTQVEYLEWKRRDQANDPPILFMKVALEGARSIQGDKNNASYKVLLTHLHHCFAEGRPKAPSADEKMEKNYLHPPQKTTAVVDFDGPAGSMLFFWCDSAESGTRIGGYDNDCDEVCHFEWN